MKHHHKHYIIPHRTASPNASGPWLKFEVTYGKRPCRILSQKGQVRLQVVSLDLDQSPILHPPLKKEMRSIVKSLVDAFPGIIEWSNEEWQELFRKEPDPQQEFHHWMAVAQVFQKFADGKPLTHQIELFRLLALCNSRPINVEPVGNRGEILSDDEVDTILDAYYARYMGG